MQNGISFQYIFFGAAKKCRGSSLIETNEHLMKNERVCVESEACLLIRREFCALMRHLLYPFSSGTYQSTNEPYKLWELCRKLGKRSHKCQKCKWTLMDGWADGDSLGLRYPTPIPPPPPPPLPFEKAGFPHPVELTMWIFITMEAYTFFGEIGCVLWGSGG